MPPRAAAAVQLTTERLLLRGWDLAADLPSFAAMCRDPDVMRYIHDGQPWTQATCRRWIEENIASLAEHGFCQWAVVRRADGELLGFCGCKHWGRAAANQSGLLGDRRPAIGWRLARAGWGAGVATEAAAAALQHGFAQCDFHSVLATVQPANVASAAVAQKLGMKISEADSDANLLSFKLDRADWAPGEGGGDGGSGGSGSGGSGGGGGGDGSSRATSRLCALADHLMAEVPVIAPCSIRDSSAIELVHAAPLFDLSKQLIAPDGGLTAAQMQQLDCDGHLLLPGLLTPEATESIAGAIKQVGSFGGKWKAKHRPKAELAQLREMAIRAGGAESDADATAFAKVAGELATRFPAAGMHSPGACPYEWNTTMAGVIGHPQMLRLARAALGPDIRFDHQVLLNKQPGTGEQAYHTHEYADGCAPFQNIAPQVGGATSSGLMSLQTLLHHVYARAGQLQSSTRSVNDPALGYIRVFFYCTGFEHDDGNLKVVRGSHMFRDATVNCLGDAALEEHWLAGKTHPMTGEPLEIEQLSCPPGSVVIMWCGQTRHPWRQISNFRLSDCDGRHLMALCIHACVVQDARCPRGLCAQGGQRRAPRGDHSLPQPGRAEPRPLDQRCVGTAAGHGPGVCSAWAGGAEGPHLAVTLQRVLRT